MDEDLRAAKDAGVKLTAEEEAKLAAKEFTAKEGDVMLVAVKVLDVHDRGNIVVEVVGSTRQLALSASELLNSKNVMRASMERSGRHAPQAP